MGAMSEPGVTGTDQLMPDDGEDFHSPTVLIGKDSQITIEWPESGKSRNVQMSTELFEEWVGMLNATRRLAELLLTSIAAERRQHPDGEPGRVQPEIRQEIDHLKEMLRME